MDIRQNERGKLANFYVELMELDDVESLELQVNLTREQIKNWGEGLAALALVPIEMNWDKSFERLFAVVKACQKWQAGPQLIQADLIEQLEGLPSSKKRELVETLIKVDGQKTTWAKNLNVNPELLEFFSINTFRPVLKAYAQKVLTQLPQGDWEKAHCPVCGDQPTMAKLAGKEGFRNLYCGRCETEWRYKRIGCPYCQNNSAPSVSYLTLEDNKQYRIYLCEHCKSYLKTVDERVCGEVDLFCEDLATDELDRLAQEEGYRRGDMRQQV